METKRLYPYRPIHPGEILKDEVDYRKLDHRKLAEVMGVTLETLEDTLNEKLPVTAEFAFRINAVIGVAADTLVRMQADYDIQVADWDKQLAKQRDEIRNKSKMAGMYVVPAIPKDDEYEYDEDFRYTVYGNMQNFEPLRVAA